jgi:hypothetical protein
MATSKKSSRVAPRPTPPPRPAVETIRPVLPHDSEERLEVVEAAGDTYARSCWILLFLLVLLAIAIGLYYALR